MTVHHLTQKDLADRRSETAVRINRLRLDTPENICASMDALKALFQIGAVEICMVKRGSGVIEFVAKEKP
jgi:hypothetical protein